MTDLTPTERKVDRPENDFLVRIPGESRVRRARVDPETGWVFSESDPVWRITREPSPPGLVSAILTCSFHDGMDLVTRHKRVCAVLAAAGPGGALADLFIHQVSKRAGEIEEELRVPCDLLGIEGFEAVIDEIEDQCRD